MGIGALGAGSAVGAVGGLIGNIAVLAGAAGDGGEDTLNRIIKLWQKLQTPDYDMRDLDPVELQVVAEFFPNFYEAVVPDEVKTIADSPEMRDSQMRGLAHLERVEQEGLPLGERLAAQEQGRRIGREAARVDQGVVRDLQERGRAGGGTELQARMAAGQNASEYARGFGSDLAARAENNRLRAAGDVIGAAGGIRGQDVGVQQSNADMINRFNEYVAQTMTASNQYGAGAQERAQGYNVGTRQGVADRNVGLQNEFNIYNRDTANRLRSQAYQDALARLQGLSSAYGARADAEYADQAARTEALQSLGQGVGQGVGGIVQKAYGPPQARY